LHKQQKTKTNEKEQNNS